MILIFSGPSAIGKDSTWIKAAEDLGFFKYVPYTTRPPRKNEVNLVDYNFIEINSFQKYIRDNEFLEWDFFFNNYYGTKKDIQIIQESQELIVLHSLFKIGHRLTRKLNDCYTVSLTTSDLNTLTDRLIQRKCSVEEMTFRLNHMKEENIHSPLSDFCINDAASISLDEAKLKIEGIVNNISRKL